MKIQPGNALVVFIISFLFCNPSYSQEKIKVVRLGTKPIIQPEMFTGDAGENINGPTLIKVPDWIDKPMGKYYLYFAHHYGKYIRLAYADDLLGPWKIYEKGILNIEDDPTIYDNNHHPLVRHIASPDLLADSLNKAFVLYFHCRKNLTHYSSRAVSRNGIDFLPGKQPLGKPYFKVFKWKDQFYAMATGGQLYQSADGISNFVEGPNPFQKHGITKRIRHCAVMVRENMLYVFFSRTRDKPERILVSRIALTDDWNNWLPCKPETVIEPQLDYEGVNEPLKKSVGGASFKPVRELRDPALFEENGKSYLLYSVSGEKGISIAELRFEK